LRDSGKEEYIKVSLTNTEVLALNGTPLEILPAPGVNKTYNISPKSQVYFNSNTAYITNTDLQFAWAVGGGIAATNGAILLTSATEATQKLIPASEDVLEVNSALDVKVGTGNPGNGNVANVLIIELYYDKIEA